VQHSLPSRENAPILRGFLKKSREILRRGAAALFNNRALSARLGSLLTSKAASYSSQSIAVGIMATIGDRER
jgi:hypothetical protein